MKEMILVSTLLLLSSMSAYSEFIPATSWNNAKNTLDDQVYYDHRLTFYCGCAYTSDGDYDGSGDIDADACGLGDVPNMQHVKDTIQWEHIVPASLMPVGDFMCWQNEKEVSQCQRSDGTVKYRNRVCCERVSPSGKLMIFDMFNLAPSAAQLNQYRSNDPYGEVPDNSGFEGFGQSCEARDLNGTTSGPEGLFEPPNCKKGDVARTWFYMQLAHGVLINPATYALFRSWSDLDPVSPWERERHDRISAIQGNINPYIDNVTTDIAGACPWEPISFD